MKVNLDEIDFDYRPATFTEIDNGHTVQVNVAAGSFIQVGPERYELVQFHFHRPSEERINGKGTEMVIHLVHRGSGGKLAVVAVLLERGKGNDAIQTVWNNIPLEKGQLGSPRHRTRPVRAAAEPAHLLHLHGFDDRTALYRKRAVAGDEAADDGLAGADGAVLAPVSAQCAAGAGERRADGEGIELIS